MPATRKPLCAVRLTLSLPVDPQFRRAVQGVGECGPSNPHHPAGSGLSGSGASGTASAGGASTSTEQDEAGGQEEEGGPKPWVIKGWLKVANKKLTAMHNSAQRFRLEPTHVRAHPITIPFSPLSLSRRSGPVFTRQQEPRKSLARRQERESNLGGP